MRTHCIQCIKSGIASIFPYSTRGLRTGKLPEPRQFILDLICDCQEQVSMRDGYLQRSYTLECNNIIFRVGISLRIYCFTIRSNLLYLN